MNHDNRGIYVRYVKRILDFTISLISLIILSPLLLLLTVIGAIAMHGNPFFVQARPGRKGPDGEEQIFHLVKFRTMTDQRDASGRLLPDSLRLNGYGRFLRKTSLDELTELINILRGDMALVGPRPLLVEYLPYYTQTERRRHTVRPGLTGLAQVSGRNSLAWDARLATDVEYVDHISFFTDLKIIFMTVAVAVKQSGVAEDTNQAEGNLAEIRREKQAVR